MAEIRVAKEYSRLLSNTVIEIYDDRIIKLARAMCKARGISEQCYDMFLDRAQQFSETGSCSRETP